MFYFLRTFAPSGSKIILTMVDRYEQLFERLQFYERKIKELLSDRRAGWEDILCSPVCQSAADKLSHICICHAIYDLNMHKPYSIPDILRMNDFSVEVTVKHQHFGKVKSINN